MKFPNTQHWWPSTRSVRPSSSALLGAQPKRAGRISATSFKRSAIVSGKRSTSDRARDRAALSERIVKLQRRVRELGNLVKQKDDEIKAARYLLRHLKDLPRTSAATADAWALRLTRACLSEHRP